MHLQTLADLDFLSSGLVASYQTPAKRVELRNIATCYLLVSQPAAASHVADVQVILL